MPQASKSSKIKKHMVTWDAKMWAQIERAAQHLSQTMASETTVPAFIRGAVQRRIDEVLGKPSAR